MKRGYEGMTEERIVYALKDEKENYVGSNSIQYDKKTKQHYYVYSHFLSDAFFTYTMESQAQEVLDKLESLAIQLNCKKEFYIKRIDLNKALVDEYAKNKDKTKTYPFIHELIFIMEMDGATVIVA
jgi:hypothetical protein